MPVDGWKRDAIEPPPKHEMLSEIDDLAPAPPQFVRLCCAAGCSRAARPGGGYCRPCHAAAERRRKRKKGEKLRTEKRDRNAARTPEEKMRDVARAKLAVYIARGKIKRLLCEHPQCHASETTAYIAYPANWRTPAWLCSEHRQGHIEAAESRERTRVQIDAYATRRAQALAAFAALPAATQDAIRAHAARGPSGIVLSPEAPLYVQRLVAEVERVLSP